ncbi:hypothetical protein [Bacteroides sp.]|uniref:hypothetical protein n=1 Tax=Bacteroides sp. TaxID=29523 RepID=UPI002617223C|nr:hypothetical protein [Bacteroides sp.]
MKFYNNMRYIQLFMATVLMALLTVSCDQDLPYPLDDVKDGVVIDIARVAGTDGVLAVGITEGNYKVKLTIPKQQGDYSALDYAQLLCVFTDVSGKTTSKVVVDNIKDFPKDIDLDIANVYQQFGLTKPALGETLYFTTNAVLKDGYIVAGWNAISGFNNKAFTGWEVDGRAYSYNVRYSVACQLILDEFERTVSVEDGFWEDVYDAKLVKKSDTELELQGILGDPDTNPIVITVDPTDHSVSVKKQVITPIFSPYTNLSVEASGTIDACNGSITFTGTFTVDQGSFGSAKVVIR